MSDADLAGGEANGVRLDAASPLAPEPPAPPELPPSPSPPTLPPVIVHAVLLKHRPPLRSGQVVCGTQAQVQALGAAARPATDAEISISAPSHFALEA